jgi:hypothetical protein
MQQAGTHFSCFTVTKAQILTQRSAYLYNFITHLRATAAPTLQLALLLLPLPLPAPTNTIARRMQKQREVRQQLHLNTSISLARRLCCSRSVPALAT